MYKEDFIQLTKRLLQDEFEAFMAALETEPPVSIRINPRKFGAIHVEPVEKTPDDTAFNVKDALLMNRAERIPWCETGYYLPRRPSFTYDPLFHAGAYYVQEASSMFLEQAMQTILIDPGIAKSGIRALDLCAAPGGKSTHLLSLLPDDCLLVSNEIIHGRSLVLAENIAKWGRANTIITQNDAIDFGRIPHFFDVIVADLPCSGEGLFRKNPAARNEWSIEQVKLCASRQRRIVRDVWDALKPGGYLIYSTCTFNTEENEDNIRMLSGELGAEIIPITIKPEWNIKPSYGLTVLPPYGLTVLPSYGLNTVLPVYRFFPHHIRGEGFFLALLRKNNDSSEIQVSGSRRRLPGSRTTSQGPKSQVHVPSHIKNMLSNPEKFVFRNANSKIKPGETGIGLCNLLYTIPLKHESAFTTLSACLKIISAGLPLGESKGDDFVPSAPLALSTELSDHAFPSIELSCEQAISYLKRNMMTLPDNTSKGYFLVIYRNIPLGFVKNTGVRANNLFPREWRIRR